MAIEHQFGGTFPDGTFISGTDFAGYVLAHELGHFLGLVPPSQREQPHAAASCQQLA